MPRSRIERDSVRRSGSGGGAGGTPTWGSIIGPGPVCYTVLTPAVIVADQDDYNPADLATAIIVRLETSVVAGIDITGIVPPDATKPCILILENVGSTNAINLINQDAGSAAGNRFEIPERIRLNAFEAQPIKYDPDNLRWHIYNGAIPDQAISNERLRDSSSRSVIGRSAVSSGTPADIIAGSDGDVLQRAAGVLVFAPSPASAGIAPVNFYAGQGMIDSSGSDWPTSVVAPAAPDAVKNFMVSRELVDDAVTGFGLQFDVPTGTTQVKVRIMSRGTGTTGPWVPILRASSMGDNAAPDAFSAEEPMTALSMPADTDWQYDEQTLLYTAIGNLTAGERGAMQLTRDKAGQAGDTLATSVFIYHVQLVFS